MERLSYKTLKKQGYEGYLLENAPEKVVQFGEGNFLRAFVDYWFDLMNERGGFNGKIVLVTPRDHRGRRDTVKMFNEQDGLYTLYLRGQENEQKTEKKRIISSVSRCLNPYAEYEEFLACARNPDIEFIVSNTTEAGITYDPDTRFEQTPPNSFPGKIVRFLYERWKNGLPGLMILACELIDHNGEEMKRIVLRHISEWGLEKEFALWVEEENIFCSSLVDRIVPGYPRVDAGQLTEQNGYEDLLMDTGEIFGLWVIEGPEELEKKLPIARSGLAENILVVRDHTPYKQRKVRILNGAHTSFVPGAFLSGENIVRDSMKDEWICSFMNCCIYDEIIPTLDLPRDELERFADSVVDRFSNPFIDHRLLDICLNSTSKWKARVLPSLLAYIRRFKKLPSCLTASFAMYLAFYRVKEVTEAGFFGDRNGERYQINDDPAVLKFYNEHRNDAIPSYVVSACGRIDFWGEDLNAIEGFADEVIRCMEIIDRDGPKALMKMAAESHC